MFGLGLLVMAGLLVFSALSSRSHQGFKVLYSNVSDADGAAIIASLQQMNVPYQFTEGGGAIMVPQSSVYETRLKLAGQGLPKGGNVGFELLENQKFGTSQFVERVNYLRGLEGELARSISSLGQVKSARVHLAVPKQTAFVREQERPSASVVVKLHPGRVLDPAQVAAIARLVSASVPGMQVQDVAIMDADGGVVSPNPLRQAGLDASQIKYTAELEAALTRRLGVILEPLAGKDGFRAEVTVDMDFDEREKTSETFSKNSPPNAQSIRSQQSIDAGPARGTSGGIPGSLTNQPQQPAEAPIVNEVATPASPANAQRNLRAPGEVETGVSVSDNSPLRSERTVNYEVDRAIERLKSSKGNVRRVSAAVVLDHKLSGTAKVPFTPQEITQITSLVKDAIGFQQTRGDTVSVANLPFSMEAPVETPSWTPELTSQLLSYGRDRLRQEIAERDEEWALQEEAWKAEAEQRERMVRAEAERQTAKESQSKRLYDELLDYARSYVTQNQDKAAFLLRAWAAESKPGSGERS
ncbi:MAG: flagellar M-ring protein FliF [Burkholderiaceae bacterium]|nr:flagellar M-ring protein FliF [Burkholderiaceae bacterium]